MLGAASAHSTLVVMTTAPGNSVTGHEAEAVVLILDATFTSSLFVAIQFSKSWFPAHANNPGSAQKDTGNHPC
jgi:hypothetical protein